MTPPAGPAPDPAPRRNWIDWLEQRVNLSEIVSFVSHFGFVYTPVDSSRPVREVLRQVAAEPVPAIARGPRVLGLIAAILFGLEALTGILMCGWSTGFFFAVVSRMFETRTPSSKPTP